MNAAAPLKRTDEKPGHVGELVSCDPVFTPEFWAQRLVGRSHASIEESRSLWDAKAPRFARKTERSGYLDHMLDLIARICEPDDSIFDMGCGPGTLSIPLAEAGYRVVAVDFSGTMLSELDRAAAALEAHVRSRIETHQRAWQDSWGDLPQADIALSSRSLIADDIPSAIAKLESKARKRCIVTVAGGETPWLDTRVLAAIGRPANSVSTRLELVSLVNYLFALGRNVAIEQIVCPRQWHSDSIDELAQALSESVAPTPEEQRAIERFVRDHALQDEGTGDYRLDYVQRTTWCALMWEPPAR